MRAIINVLVTTVAIGLNTGQLQAAPAGAQGVPEQSAPSLKLLVQADRYDEGYLPLLFPPASSTPAISGPTAAGVAVVGQAAIGLSVRGAIIMNAGLTGTTQAPGRIAAVID